MKSSIWSAAFVIAMLTVFVGVQSSIDMQAQAGASRPSMTAKLVDPEKKAAEREATVEVTVTGVELIDPAKAVDKQAATQGHLHYQVDKGPVIATPAPKLSFHELSPGSHTIVVALVGNDHKPIGPQERLTLTVPKGMTSGSKPSESGGVGTAGKEAPASTPAKKSGY